MNNNAINLFRNHKKNNDSQVKVLRMFRIISVASFCIIFVLSIGLYGIYAQSSLPTLKNQEAALLTQLTANKAKIEKIQITQSRIKAIEEILNNRSKIDELITFIVSLLSDAVVVDSFVIEKKTITMTISSSSLSAIDQVVKNFLDNTGPDKKFSKIILDDLAVDGTRKFYSLAMHIEI